VKQLHNAHILSVRAADTDDQRRTLPAGEPPRLPRLVPDSPRLDDTDPPESGREGAPLAPSLSLGLSLHLLLFRDGLLVVDRHVGDLHRLPGDGVGRNDVRERSRAAAAAGVREEIALGPRESPAHGHVQDHEEAVIGRALPGVCRDLSRVDREVVGPIEVVAQLVRLVELIVK